MWHQESKGILYLSSAEKLSIKSLLTAKLPTASFMVQNTKMVNLKNAKSKDKENIGVLVLFIPLNLNFSLLPEQRCCFASSLLAGIPLTLFQLLLYLLFYHPVHYFVF